MSEELKQTYCPHCGCHILRKTDKIKLTCPLCSREFVTHEARSALFDEMVKGLESMREILGNLDQRKWPAPQQEAQAIAIQLLAKAKEQQ